MMGGAGGTGRCTHNALLLLGGLSVCECILQRQHWHHWLSLISIKKCSRGESDGRREGANEGGGEGEMEVRRAGVTERAGRAKREV